MKLKKLSLFMREHRHRQVTIAIREVQKMPLERDIRVFL